MPVELNDDNKATIIEIYNRSVKLLELLNVLIPKIDKFDAKLPSGLMQEVLDMCFELGAHLSTDEAAALEQKPEPEKDEDEYESFGFPIM
jgi:hypothetical protein